MINGHVSWKAAIELALQSRLWEEIMNLRGFVIAPRWFEFSE